MTYIPDSAFVSNRRTCLYRCIDAYSCIMYVLICVCSELSMHVCPQPPSSSSTAMLYRMMLS